MEKRHFFNGTMSSFSIAAGGLLLAYCLIGCNSSEFAGQQDQEHERPYKENEHNESEISHSDDLSSKPSDPEGLIDSEPLVIENTGLSCARPIADLNGNWQGNIEGHHEELGEVRTILNSVLLHSGSSLLKFENFLLSNASWATGLASNSLDSLQPQTFEVSCNQADFESFHIMMGNGLTHIYFKLTRHQWNPNKISGTWVLRNIRTGVEPATGKWHLKQRHGL